MRQFPKRKRLARCARGTCDDALPPRLIFNSVADEVTSLTLKSLTSNRVDKPVPTGLSQAIQNQNRQNRRVRRFSTDLIPLYQPLTTIKIGVRRFSHGLTFSLSPFLHRRLALDPRPSTLDSPGRALFPRCTDSPCPPNGVHHWAIAASNHAGYAYV